METEPYNEEQVKRGGYKGWKGEGAMATLTTRPWCWTEAKVKCLFICVHFVFAVRIYNIFLRGSLTLVSLGLLSTTEQADWQTSRQTNKQKESSRSVCRCTEPQDKPADTLLKWLQLQTTWLASGSKTIWLGWGTDYGLIKISLLIQEVIWAGVSGSLYDCR